MLRARRGRRRPGGAHHTEEGDNAERSARAPGVRDYQCNVAGDGSGVRHASNYLGLVARYVTLVVANAWRTRGPLRILSLLCVVGAAWTASAAARTEHGDDCPLAQ